MFNIPIENNVSYTDIYDGKTWIHGTSKEDIKLTIFLITINSKQLEYSLKSINNLEIKYNVVINVIMNICPTNKAYNEMRIRCNTDYFIQNDEDMELIPNALDIFYDIINNNNKKNNNIFLHTFKLIDESLGIGNPPIIDCLKLYNNEIMKKYPTYNNGKEIVSSVDSLWHKRILNNGYNIKNTNIIIGYHGKHRSPFDLMLRHCKILTSIQDNRIKLRSSQLCKILRFLYKNNDNIEFYFKFIIYHYIHFTKQGININKLNFIIDKLNTHVNKQILHSYGIINRYIIPHFKESDLIINKHIFNKTNKIKKNINIEQFFCIVGIICIVTNNYAYSADKYPYKIYNYFYNIIN